MAYFLVALLLIPLTSHLEAKDFGVRGHTFPVYEYNMLDMLNVRNVRGMRQTYDELQDRFIQRFRSPSAITWLGRASRYRNWTFDPSVTLQLDILDHEGRVVIPKGTRINPLERVSLSSPLLFFDSRIEQQLLWARTKTGKWILTGGRPLDLEEEEGRPVYFDQFAYLVHRFGIKALPARVFQEGNRLVVEELLIDEEGRCIR